MANESISFVDAIKVGFSKYASFDGCAGRPEFWWWTLFTFLGSLALQTISYSLSGLFTVVTLLPSLAVTARRLHDTDRSGWWQLLWLVPLVGWIVMIIFCVEEGKPNRYGGMPAGPAPA